MWGSIISTLGGLIGQKKTNEENKDLMRETHDYQQRNSDTQYVRAAADLKAAGINPILAPQFGGASTPSGNLATMVNPMQGASLGATTAKTIQDKEQSKIKTDLDKLKKPEAQVNAEAYKIILAAMMEAKRFGTTDEAKSYYQSIEAAAQNLNNKTHGFIMDSYQKFLKIDKQIAAKYLSLFKQATSNPKNAGKHAKRLGK